MLIVELVLSIPRNLAARLVVCDDVLLTDELVRIV